MTTCSQCGGTLRRLSEWFDDVSELWIDELECEACGALFLARRSSPPPQASLFDEADT